MALSSTLKEALQERNISKIHSSFYTILLSDPGFSTNKFDEALKAAEELNIPGFIQPYDGKEFEPEDSWDQEYWDKIASELMDNFCMERIQHLKKVARKVYPLVKSLQGKNNQAEGTQKKTQDILVQSMDTGRQSSNMGIVIAIAGGLLILLIIVLVLMQ